MVKYLFMVKYSILNPSRKYMKTVHDHVWLLTSAVWVKKKKKKKKK